MEDKENLRAQYRECVENYRMWDRHIWQLPSITILIVSAIIGGAFGILKDHLLASCFLLVLGTIFSFSMFVALEKHRFFQKCTINLMRDIENELRLNPLPLRDEELSTQDLEKRCFFEEWSAGIMFGGFIFFLFISLTMLFIHSIVKGVKGGVISCWTLFLMMAAVLLYIVFIVVKHRVKKTRRIELQSK